MTWHKNAGFKCGTSILHMSRWKQNLP